ncbi:MAG: elongation factor P maturation arginine rhamnosyltransferase EarP [Rhodocyclaceae bacterium]|nr:elongation factor P maturation arginine rhamnosyltransferase EarP [Rhodocyclaceae bacterium]
MRDQIPAATWDIFCTVVDNYGDIGVCWRLARQLAHERKHPVRLWVDDLMSFARLLPGLDARRESQTLRGVDIRHWRTPFPGTEPGKVVIEAFACELPENFIRAMARRDPAPAWLNLEYLSAEAWVAGCHGLPSPHPRLPLLKYFFFPGFSAGTGGLLLESGLLEQRAAFQADPAATAAFWSRLGLPPRGDAELRLSLFSYANVATLDLLETWGSATYPITCLVPEGTAAATLAGAEFGFEPQAGRHCRHGNLALHILPFLEQDDYDRLLWACDLNFVRGEDSFVRAQWAARPFVWHIYPQREDVHHEKLNAFLDLYGAALAPEAAEAVRRLWHGWNGIGTSGDIVGAWNDFAIQLPTLNAHGPDWAGQLAKRGDLAGNLELFVNSRL